MSSGSPRAHPLRHKWSPCIPSPSTTVHWERLPSHSGNNLVSQTTRRCTYPEVTCPTTLVLVLTPSSLHNSSFRYPVRTYPCFCQGSYRQSHPGLSDPRVSFSPDPLSSDTDTLPGQDPHEPTPSWTPSPHRPEKEGIVGSGRPEGSEGGRLRSQT